MDKIKKYKMNNTCNNKQLMLQRVIEDENYIIQTMVQHYLAAENMEISPNRLIEWREIIQLERDEVKKYVEKING